MRKILLNPGDMFGRLKVLSDVGVNKKGETLWLCQCVCGEYKEVPVSRLRSGSVASCGCLRQETAANTGRETSTTHGHASTGDVSKTYSSWSSMVERCDERYKDKFRFHSGRGIAVCARWRESFENFLADMGERPENKTLDRIDPNGNYEPGNCRWATDKEQGENKRSTIWVDDHGVLKTLWTISTEYEFNYSVVWARYKKGLRMPELVGPRQKAYGLKKILNEAV